MKKALLLTLILCIYALLSANNNVYAATTLISEDFESYTVGTWPTPWVPDANAHDSSNNKIVLDPEDPSNQVLKLYGSVGGCWGALTYYPMNLLEDFYIEAKVYNGSETLTGCHPYRGGFSLRHGTYWYAVTNPSFGLMSFHQTTAGPSINDVLLNYQVNRWYDTKIHYNRSGDQVTLTYWIDGEYLGQIIKVVDLEKHLTMDHFQLDAQEGSAYFDDVKVYVAIDVDGDGYTADEDCDDLNSNTFPGALEICDGEDNDCDDNIPDDEVDLDGDNFLACNDCDDNNIDVNPQKVEVPGNYIDENCDGDLGDCWPCLSWKNHGEYVRCTAHAVDDLIADGILTEDEGCDIVSASAQSDIGKANYTPPECQ